MSIAENLADLLLHHVTKTCDQKVKAHVCLYYHFIFKFLFYFLFLVLCKVSAVNTKITFKINKIFLIVCMCVCV